MDVLCQIDLDGIRILDPTTSRTLRIYSLENVTKMEVLDSYSSIQVKEMGENSMPSDAIKGSESDAEKKKGFSWMKLMRPLNEEKYHWVPDEAVRKCTACGTDFSAFVRSTTAEIVGIFSVTNVHKIEMAEVTQRLTNAKAAVRIAALPSHVDLAKKLQEEMDKKRKTSTDISHC